MESYRTEEEQVEALKRWWDENGKSVVAAVVIALAGGFGWQAWKDYNVDQAASASDAYQALLERVGVAQPNAEQTLEGKNLAEELKAQYPGSTYAQFAALHLAKMAVQRDDLAEAEAQLRWVLGKADAGSDMAQIAQLRLARVVAAVGDVSQALSLLESGGPNYRAAYAMARGDVLLADGQQDAARDAYTNAQLIIAENPGQANIESLDQKLQSLNPVPAQAYEAAATEQVTEAAADETLPAAEEQAEDAPTDESE